MAESIANKAAGYIADVLPAHAGWTATSRDRTSIDARAQHPQAEPAVQSRPTR